MRIELPTSGPACGGEYNGGGVQVGAVEVAVDVRAAGTGREPGGGAYCFAVMVVVRLDQAVQAAHANTTAAATRTVTTFRSAPERGPPKLVTSDPSNGNQHGDTMAAITAAPMNGDQIPFVHSVDGGCPGVGFDDWVAAGVDAVACVIGDPHAVGPDRVADRDGQLGDEACATSATTTSLT